MERTSKKMLGAVAIIAAFALFAFADINGGMPMAVFLTVAIAVYFFPSIIAVVRGHRQTLAISLLNLLLGWTGLGWIGALVWAATN